ncbi:MAG: ice-binding family protein [Salinivirgaceae bacterium]|jgi:hypothetical protein|nr:ice-binding family protein [Salinivirgaceae bacterium]
MKNQLLYSLLIVMLFFLPAPGFAQSPDLGTAADFVLFSTDGAVSNTGISHLTGNVGTNNGSSTAFGNVDGSMHDGDAASIQCAADLLTAYNQLAAMTPAFFPASLLGNGQTLQAGVYSISSAATLNADLTLDAEGDSDAIFIFQIQAPFSTNASSQVLLTNGALACNVFWKVEGLISMASGTSMKGTLIANNSAIEMNTGDTLEGRALSIAGAITVDGVLAYTPIGCGSPVLSGPVAPDLGAAACYALFSSDGAVTNSGVTNLVGDVGTNVGSTTGYDPLLVAGTIHTIPDGSTALSATDLLVAYNYINTLPYDIELLYPEQFGNNLVLTPHTYLMDGAVTFTDTVTLNAQGNEDAVFVIQINGAIITSTYSRVKLLNGAQAKNVYWKIEGAVTINDYSTFCGTIICNNGALGAINTGVELKGRLLTTNGALNTMAANGVAEMIPGNCATLSAQAHDGFINAITIYPNPFGGSTTVFVNDVAQINNAELRIYNALGIEMMNMPITREQTILETQDFPSGLFFYVVISNRKTIQSGKLLIQQ